MSRGGNSEHEYGKVVCPKCHKINPVNAEFCMFCGTKFKTSLGEQIWWFLLGFLFVVVLSLVVFRM